MVQWLLQIITTFVVIQSYTDASIIEEQSIPLSSNRYKRQTTTCAEKYSTITTDHSACLSRSSNYVSGGVSSADKQVIVDMHNTARREVTPTATNMQLMSWDDEIANTAQRWAENCDISHDGNYKRYAFGRFSVGQNLAWGSSLSWQRAIELWENEKSLFTFGGSNIGSQVGHYTQMVWADSSKIGCGYALCGGTRYYVCNYGPAGNLDINNPYTSGTTCSVCQNNCNQGLCDCSHTCLNGGTMNWNTCTCSCKRNLAFYIQPDCALNCTGAQDPSYCSQYGSVGCSKYTNVPQECPNMCSWCPTAGYKPQDTTTTSSTTPFTTTPSTSTSSTTSSLSTRITQGQTTAGVQPTTPSGAAKSTLSTLYFCVLYSVLLVLCC